MQGAIRPYVTAGVALVGASVIAISPVAPPVPDIKAAATPAVSSALQLSSATNPLVAFTDLFTNTVGNVNGLIEQLVADPAPILGQVLLNQVANVEFIAAIAEEVVNLLPQVAEVVQNGIQTIITDLAAGNITGAGQALFQTIVFSALPLLGFITPPLAIANHTIQNLAAASQAFFDNFLTTALAFITPLGSVINGAADIGQTIYDAVGEGDFVSAVGALVSAPIVMVDVILNGFGFTGGLLTPVNGPIGALLAFRNVIADALTPIPSTATAAALAADDAPAAAGDVVTLNVGAEGKSAEVAGASSGEAEEAVTLLANTGGTDESGAAAAEEQEAEDEASEEQAADEADSEEDAGDDGKKANGGDDLSDGNKAEPGGTSGSSAAESSAKNQLSDTMEKLGVKSGAFGLGGGSDAGSDGDSGDSDTDGDAGGSDAGGDE